MLDIEEIGYFIFMEEQERKAAQQEEVNVNSKYDLVPKLTATSEEEEDEQKFPEYTPAPF